MSEKAPFNTKQTVLIAFLFDLVKYHNGSNKAPTRHFASGKRLFIDGTFYFRRFAFSSSFCFHKQKRERVASRENISFFFSFRFQPFPLINKKVLLVLPWCFRGALQEHNSWAIKWEQREARFDSCCYKNWWMPFVLFSKGTSEFPASNQRVGIEAKNIRIGASHSSILPLYLFLSLFPFLYSSLHSFAWFLFLAWTQWACNNLCVPFSIFWAPSTILLLSNTL